MVGLTGAVGKWPGEPTRDLADRLILALLTGLCDLGSQFSLSVSVTHQREVRRTAVGRDGS